MAAVSAPETLPLVGVVEIAMAAGEPERERSKREDSPMASASESSGVLASAVSNWVARDPDFPVPVAELACGPVS